MSKLRICGGKYRGRSIVVPRGELEIRPAMDKMRESAFSILGDLHGAAFLDLFSGSGIIALEAASRGASTLACVERDRSKFPQLLQNVGLADEHIECHCLPVERFIKRCKSQWTHIFCDPPFPYQFKSQLLEQISQAGILAPGGLVLIHYPAHDRLAERYGSLCLSDERHYGRSTLRFYTYGETGMDEASISGLDDAGGGQDAP